MTIRLKPGEKRPLRDLGIGERLDIDVDFGLEGLDIAAFPLNASKRIGDDRYVVLFSNLASPGSEITMTPARDSARISIDLARLPADIDRIVLTATHDSEPVGRSRPLAVTFDGKASFNVADSLNQEKAVMLAEIYRHATGWRVGAIAQGFNGGLAQLVTHFGGSVGDEDAPSPSPTTNTRSVTPPAPSPKPSISLQKVTLEKKQSISLKKQGTSFGEIVLNLNWSQGRYAVDIDLGCLYEFKDGTRGVVQSLGNGFGNYDHFPYIELSGDDRSGAVSSGETIRINGRHFDEISRLAVFAFIYQGAPNWDSTDAVATLKVPGQGDIEVQLTGGRSSSTFCSIAIIDNVGGEMKVTRHVEYQKGHKAYADSVGIFMDWTPTRKD